MSDEREREFWYPDPTVQIRIRAVLCVVIPLLLIAAAFGAHAAPPDATFALSTEAGEKPASTVLTWDCKGASATAISDPPQKAWTGTLALAGSRKMTGITIPIAYSLKCDSAPTTSGFYVKWQMDSLVNSDGSPLTDLLAWDIAYGTQAPEVLTTHVRVPTPTAREAFIEAPPGDYFVAVSGVVSRTIAGNAAEMLGHQSNIVPKTATAAQAESTTITKTIEVYTLPAAPVAQ